MAEGDLETTCTAAAPLAEWLRGVLQAGVLAPSADNHARFCFEPVAEAVLVWYREGSLPPAGGYRRVLDLLSLGAIVENMHLAAAPHGRAAVIHSFPEPAPPELVCRITWQTAATRAEALWQQIPRRTTNRRLVFRGPPLTPTEMSDLQAALQPRCHLHWFNAGRARATALRLIRRAETERFRNRALHADLFSGIRFDVGWEAASDEGLPPGALGVERPFRPAFKQMRHWPLMRLANLFGMHWLLGLRAAWLPCWLAPHLGVIAVDRLDDAAVIAAGRSFQNLWLRVTALGLALQPMPASALYALEGAVAESVPQALCRRLRQGWQDLLPGVLPVMLFRLGHAPPMPVRTGRKPLAAHLCPRT